MDERVGVGVLGLQVLVCARGGGGVGCSHTLPRGSCSHAHPGALGLTEETWT